MVVALFRMEDIFAAHRHGPPMRCVANALKGATTRSPASISSAYTKIATTISLACCLADRIGIGGAGMMLTIVDNSSRAASASTMKAVRTSDVVEHSKRMYQKGKVLCH
jgi:hypothetical protein